MTPVLITGGAGFVGSNLANRILGSGRPVILFDNLARPRVTENLAWLKRRHRTLAVEIGDVRDSGHLAHAVNRAGQVFHLAAQVAVTTSVADPAADFAINAAGTVNLLEAIRRSGHRPPLVFTSTNKVYGKLDGIAVVRDDRRYAPDDPAIRRHGVGERQPLDFCSPYGCSKGAADQYVLDYARIYGLPAVVFRMSCLYGPRQFGTEDQGWVAHFLIQALAGRPITIFGDGRQVRDLLFVDDVVDAFLLAQTHMPAIAGGAFNIGGGPGNTVSLLDLLDLIAAAERRRPDRAFAPWRPGDQPWYVSDIRRFQAATGWRPTVPVPAGVQRLAAWLKGHYRPEPATAAGAVVA